MKMKQTFLVITLFVFCFLFSPIFLKQSLALENCDPADRLFTTQQRYSNPCTYQGKTMYFCYYGYNYDTAACNTKQGDKDQDAAGYTVGSIEPPPGAEQYKDSSGQVGPGGLVVFISNILKLMAIVAGVWSLFNFAIASLTYITASGANVHEKVQNKLTLSLLGLILIVMSYTVAGVIGLLFFGDAGFILSPKIPTAPTP